MREKKRRSTWRRKRKMWKRKRRERRDLMVKLTKVHSLWSKLDHFLSLKSHLDTLMTLVLY